MHYQLASLAVFSLVGAHVLLCSSVESENILFGIEMRTSSFTVTGRWIVIFKHFSYVWYPDIYVSNLLCCGGGRL